MGNLGGSQYFHSLSTHPSSAPLLKERPQKLLPCCHLSCKTCLFAPLLGSLTSSGCCCLPASVFWIWRSRQWWDVVYVWGSLVKREQGWQTLFVRLCSPCPALWFVAALGVCTAFPGSDFSWLVEERQPGTPILKAGHWMDLSFTLIHSFGHSFKHLLSICAKCWRVTERPDPVF